MGICESFLYRSEQSDLDIAVHAIKFWRQVQIHLDAASPREAVYSQGVGREELFERERGSDPDFQVWDGCALVCEGVEVA